MKKYELTDEIKKIDGRTLHRIRALKDFGNAKKGDLGGWIESEDNLSQKDDCWVFDNAVVFDDAAVWGNATVRGNATVCGNAVVCDDAAVWGNATVCGNAVVFDDAAVWGDATVSCDAAVWGNAKVCGNATVWGDAAVSGNAVVFGDATVRGDATVSCDAQLSKQTDVLTISPIGSRNDTTTFYKANGGKIFVKCGCKNVDIDAWLDMVKSTHGDNKHAKAYRLAAQIAKLQILGEEE